MVASKVLATNLGFPRIGPLRELKKAVESYWKKSITADELLKTSANLRAAQWQVQKDAGLDHIPSNVFSLYDHILDLTVTLGAVPARYGWKDGPVDLDTYFAMARGRQVKAGDPGCHCGHGHDVTAMEMTKWFDTNYHYIVPEFEDGQNFKLSSTKIFDEFEQAKKLGIITRPVIVGPATYVAIGKAKYEGFDPVATVKKLIPVYNEILARLAALGAQWVQIDEPILCLDLDDTRKKMIAAAYADLKKPAGLKILIATYFDSLRENAEIAFNLPADAIHIDLTRVTGKANTTANNAEAMLDQALALAGDKILSLGVVDGRNIWKNDLSQSLALIEKAVQKLGKDRVFVAPGCSLQHSPVDLAHEKKLDTEIKGWMAFAHQKLDEIKTLADGATKGRGAIASALTTSDAAQQSRKASKRIHDPAVQKRAAAITPDMLRRHSPFAARQKIQHAAFDLPLYPTTSIGSFPQTDAIRKARADFKKGTIPESAYDDAMKQEIKAVVDYQHGIDMDVLVHGEPERNDMVEYFGEQLAGFAFTENGWVQSYGSRCVKPPVIFGDVSRPRPMTVRWSQYAQSLTQKIMKGMLTGPITILQWSFVRDDQPRRDTAMQIALAVRDEVADLEAAGIRMIQIDEAAIREGMPLRRADAAAYLKWSVDAFKLTACTVADKTQIHTHMCYSEFNDIIAAIADMDADVISIETSRSQMELLDAFVAFKYPNEIGPGVYDIHSPRVPSVNEMVALMEKAAKLISPRNLWVNPDCGLKTRGWKEVEPALKNMTAAAKILRARG